MAEMTETFQGRANVILNGLSNGRGARCARRWLPLALIFGLLTGLTAAQTAKAQTPDTQGTIAPGTEITAQNWQKYKQFMPDGMQLLFSGTANWKMPMDIKIEVGPTSNYPLPQIYQDNTRKYSSQVKI